VENAKATKNMRERETNLDKALKSLQEYEEPEFEVDPSKDMVESEIKEAERAFNLKQIRERKERILIATEIGKLGLEENIVDIAFEAA